MQNSKEEIHPHIQPSLVGAESGAEAESLEEPELENCLMLSRPCINQPTKAARALGRPRAYSANHVPAGDGRCVYRNRRQFAGSCPERAASETRRSGRIWGVRIPQAVPLNNG
ncbi:MAG: hypothetical protein ACXVCM_10485 [Ktedonobacteraceae bacterium]